MLYRTKSKNGNSDELDEMRIEFEGIYKKHNVDIIGFWENADDPSEVYYLSKFEDEADYKSKVEELRGDARYVELTKKLEEIRLESHAVRLKPMWVAE
jgi:hypothetical protein